MASCRLQSDPRPRQVSRDRSRWRLCFAVKLISITRRAPELPPETRQVLTVAFRDFSVMRSFNRPVTRPRPQLAKGAFVTCLSIPRDPRLNAWRQQRTTITDIIDTPRPVAEVLSRFRNRPPEISDRAIRCDSTTIVSGAEAPHWLRAHRPA